MVKYFLSQLSNCEQNSHKSHLQAMCPHINYINIALKVSSKNFLLGFLTTLALYYSRPTLIRTPLLPKNSVLIREGSFCEKENHMHSQYLLKIFFLSFTEGYPFQRVAFNRGTTVYQLLVEWHRIFNRVLRRNGCFRTGIKPVNIYIYNIYIYTPVVYTVSEL